MKRTILSSLTLLLAATTLVLAGSGVLAAFSWKTTTQDLGRIPQGKPITITYSFVNKGQEPLVVTNARGSCGCTNVTYPKAAVMPGETGEIKGVFNAAAPGAFNKSIAVESNAEGGVVTLLFKGEVVAQQAGQ